MHCLVIWNDKKQSLKWALVLQKSSNANTPTIRYPDYIGQGELEIEECAKVLEPFSHALWDVFGCNLFQLNPPDISRYFFRLFKVSYIYIYIYLNIPIQLYVYDNYMYIYVCTYYPAVWYVVVLCCTVRFVEVGCLIDGCYCRHAQALGKQTQWLTIDRLWTNRHMGRWVGNKKMVRTYGFTTTQGSCPNHLKGELFCARR